MTNDNISSKKINNFLCSFVPERSQNENIWFAIKSNEKKKKEEFIIIIVFI